MNGDYTASIAETQFADRSPASKHSARVGDRVGPHSNDRRTAHLERKILGEHTYLLSLRQAYEVRE